jgi:hypothetical protein
MGECIVNCGARGCECPLHVMLSGPQRRSGFHVGGRRMCHTRRGIRAADSPASTSGTPAPITTKYLLALQHDSCWFLAGSSLDSENGRDIFL